MSRFPVVQFRGSEYLLIGTLEDGGAIATEADFRSGRASFAHLWPTGNISQFGRTIGVRNDLIVTGERDIKHSRDELVGALVGMATDASWPWNTTRGDES